jgi:hypothetical protein
MSYVEAPDGLEYCDPSDYPDVQPVQVGALLELPRWSDGSDEDPGVVHSGYPSAVPKPHQSDPSWGSAETLFYNGVKTDPGGLGYPCHTVMVDNLSNAWLRVLGRWYVRPGEVGRVIALPSATRNPDVTAKAPPGCTQPTTITGEAFVTWWEKPCQPVPGEVWGVTSSLLTGQVTVATTPTLVVNGDGGADSTAITNTSTTDIVYLGGPTVSTTTGWSLMPSATAIFRGAASVYCVSAAGGETITFAQGA